MYVYIYIYIYIYACHGNGASTSDPEIGQTPNFPFEPPKHLDNAASASESGKRG